MTIEHMARQGALIAPETQMLIAKAEATKRVPGAHGTSDGLAARQWETCILSLKFDVQSTQINLDFFT